MRYTITDQISIEPLTNHSGQVEFYNATIHGTTQSRIAIIKHHDDGEFSYPVDSKIKFTPRSCIEGTLYEEKLTR